MYLPIPVLAAIGVGVLVLVLIAWRRRGGERDLIAPPRAGAPTPSPRAKPPRAWPTGAAPIGDLADEVAGEVRKLLAAGHKIEAIRLVRAATGLGLAEAKEMVERM